MTKPELIERAKRQLNAPDLEINLAACVMQASSVVAHRVMADPAMRALLQQAYTLTLDAAGEGNLLTATGSVTGNAGEILLDGVRYGVVLDADGQRLHPLKHYHDFLAPQNTAFGYYNMRNRDKMATRAAGVQVNVAADIQSASGPLTITASFDPQDVDDYPPELEDMLVNALCEIVAAKPANATTA